MLTKRQLLQSAALASLAAPFAGAARAEESRPGFFASKDIAEAGLIFGLPIVTNYAVLHDFAIDKNSGQYKAPFNQIANNHAVFTYKDTTVVTPNSDTPYSLLFTDLRAEPLVISVPDIDPKRYYSVQLFDASTYNFGYIGSRATGNGAGDYLLAGPDWKGETPAGIKKVFRAGSTLGGGAIFRTQLFSPDDIDNVIKVQEGYKVRPLSAYLGQPAPPAAPAIDFPAIDKDSAKKNFFEYLDFMLQFIPPAANEADIRAKLAQIGVGPGKTFNFKDLPLEQKLEFALGLKDGDRKIDEAVANAGTNVNNWRVANAGGDSAFYNGVWLLRAAITRAGIYANSAEEATYPLTRLDADGDKLDGSKHKYTLTFAADALPPVNAFWSVTMYDGNTQLLIKNPIDRYLINSPLLPSLKRNADGSVTLYIQHDSPGADKESNWLPAPDGPIYLVMRLYWPKTEPPTILPPGKGDWKPPAVTKAS
jgi:hypothetical protein